MADIVPRRTSVRRHGAQEVRHSFAGYRERTRHESSRDCRGSGETRSSRKGRGHKSTSRHQQPEIAQEPSLQLHFVTNPPSRVSVYDSFDTEVHLYAFNLPQSATVHDALACGQLFATATLLSPSDGGAYLPVSDNTTLYGPQPVSVVSPFESTSSHWGYRAGKSEAIGSVNFYGLSINAEGIYKLQITLMAPRYAPLTAEADVALDSPVQGYEMVQLVVSKSIVVGH